jgi:hypothetical protein
MTETLRDHLGVDAGAQGQVAWVWRRSWGRIVGSLASLTACLK